MTRIRVALLVSSLWIDGAGGGIGRFAAELSRALDPERFAVGLYALWRFNMPSEGVLQQSLSAAGIETHTAPVWDASHPYRSFQEAVRNLRAMLATRPVDLIHSHHEFADVAALWLRRQVRAPAVVRTVHNLEWRRRPLRRLLLTHGLYPLAFQVEAGVSQAIVDQLNRRPLARFLRRNARLLHNAVDLDRFRGSATDRLEQRRQLAVPAGAFLIGSVGRLVTQKGYVYFVEAAARVRQAAPQAHFVLIGAGDMEPALRQKAAQLGLADHFTFAGTRPDVEHLLAALDLFVSSSLWEGLPTVILECMAAGVPVVATDIAGTRELLADGVTGRLVPPGDATALAAAIVELVTDAPRRAQLAAQASILAGHFSIRTVAHEHEQLYEKL
jgi:glycosyltransferase involved in cell wall biosynthesis